MWSTNKCHLYAEIVKFGLILTHLKLFGGGKWDEGKKNILGENTPMLPPPPVLPLYHKYFSKCTHWPCKIDPTLENLKQKKIILKSKFMYFV